jgi:hypothetical protein
MNRLAIGALMLLAASTLSAARVSAADMAANAGEETAEADEGDELDSENIFGFTEGSDVNEAGEREITVDMIGGIGRQRDEPGHSGYYAWEGEAEFEYGATDNLTLGVGASLSYHDIDNVAELENLSDGGFGGLGASLKYRFLSRENAPVGMAVSIEPEWSRFEDDSGERANGFEVNTKLLIDAEIVPDTLFAAFNLGYAPEWTRSKGGEADESGEDDEEAEAEEGGTEKESSLEVSGALAWQATPGVFLGGELRYLAGFEGLTLDNFEGGALYLGPSVYVQLSESSYIKAAYSYQVAGWSPESDDTQDLVGDRQQLKVSFGVEF